MTRKTWVQDPDTGKLVPKEEWRGRRGKVYIQGDIDPFISPIDGRTISSRSGLREHNAQHGVTDSRDYSKEFLVKRSHDRVDRMQGNTKQDRQERINLIRHALER